MKWGEALGSEHILVTGGAGYIGSHTTRMLLDQGYQVTVVDNLSTGYAWSVGDAELIQCDLRQPVELAGALRKKRFTGIIHFAGLSQVGESITQPLSYFDNNVTGSLNLIGYAAQAGIDQFVFSSSAAVYGNPRAAVIDETHAIAPINPYGKSKAMVETMLAESARANGLRTMALRYFNAAGAMPTCGLGEAHDPETHLIPNVLKSLLAAADPIPGDAYVKVFGNDYETPDGTCIRDYVHVTDLAQAHVSALRYVKDTAGAQAVNLGTGRGNSVLEIIDTCQQVTGKEIPHIIEPRRQGDPAVLVADNELAAKLLDWQPRLTLADIVSDAWQWHQMSS